MKSRHMLSLSALVAAFAAAAPAEVSYRERPRKMGKTLPSRTVSQPTARRGIPKKALRHCLPRR